MIDYKTIDLLETIRQEIQLWGGTNNLKYEGSWLVTRISLWDWTNNKGIEYILEAHNEYSDVGSEELLTILYNVEANTITVVAGSDMEVWLQEADGYYSEEEITNTKTAITALEIKLNEIIKEI